MSDSDRIATTICSTLQQKTHQEKKNEINLKADLIMD
jgi:hypothetical protein